MFKQWQRRVVMLLVVMCAKSVCAQIGFGTVVEFLWRSSTIGGGGFCMENRFAPSGFFGLPQERSFYLATDVAGVFRSLTMDASGNITSWERLYDEVTTTSQHILPRYTTTLAFTKKFNNASASRLIAGSSEGIFAWSNPYTWQATSVPEVSAIPNMDPADGRYPWIGIIRECWPDSTPFLAAGIGNIRAIVENTPIDPAEFGVGGMLRSLDGGANWSFVPLDGAASTEVVHDIDYFHQSGEGYAALVTTETAVYFSEDLFTALSGDAVNFKKIFVKNAAGSVLQNLRGAVVLGNTAPLATSDSLALCVSVCSLDTTGWKTAARTGGVFQLNTNLPQLRSGASLSWANMPVKNYNGYDECKNVGRVGAKPGATMSNYEMFFSKYNTPFLAATQRLNDVQYNWRRIAGPSENDDNGYKEDDKQSLKFGAFDIDPSGSFTHPNIYGCWEYGPSLAKGHNTGGNNSYGQARSYIQIFTDATGGDDAGIPLYKSRGMDELFFSGQKILFSKDHPDVLMIGCGDNQLLRSLDRGQSWSSRRLRPLADWESANPALGYDKVQQYVYHLAYHPDTESTVLASAGPSRQTAVNEGELLYHTDGGAGASSTWKKLAGGKTNVLNLPNGEIYAFTFDRRNPKKGLFVAVRNNGLYYTQVEANGAASNFVKIEDDDLQAKISVTPPNSHNYSRLEFDPYDDDVLYVSRYWPGGGVFKITLGVNGSNRAAITSGGAYNQSFITSVDEVITGRYNAAGQARTARDTIAADVINLLITQDHVYAGVTCGDTLDNANGNYSGGLVRRAKSGTTYSWKIGGPTGVGSVPKTIAIGGLAQDPLYPDTIFAVTERLKLKAKREADNMLKGEENYKVMNIWRSTDGGNTFSALPYWQTEHRFPSAVSLSFFPDSPDSMIMPTHGNGIWVAHRYDGPPYGPGVGKVNAPDSNQTQLPKRFALHANYPNPFNPTTIIKYDLPKPTHVKLTIYDVLGRRVRTLLDKEVEAGYQRAQWDGKNDRGVPVASGIYLYRLHTSFFTKVRKMTLLR